MQTIATPQLLDPDRMLANDRGSLGSADDHKARAELLDKALHETCAYAQQLWNNLDATRQYLMDALPPDPRSPGPHRSASASPTGPEDEQGWQNWIAAYASVTSVLCGPHGDSGYGLGEARQAAEERRTAPNLNFYNRHPELAEAHSPSVAGQKPEPDSRGHGAARSALTAVLVLLAVRGLRPRR
jgi:hypothetical protein